MSSKYDNEQTRAIDAFRAKSSFDRYQMTCFLRNGADNLGKRRAAWNRVETTLGLTDTWKLPRQYGLRTAVEEYDEGLEESKAMLQDQIDHGHDFFNKQTHAYRFGNSVPFGQTTMLFIPCLKSLASEEQQAKWIPKALRGEILGNYAQTELAHGTFVRGIQTTATFDEMKEEFVINSPTTSSIKFWPVALGYSTTHAIIMARLIIKAKDHGVHPFMAQLRSLDDFKPFPGIDLGDIGPKYGFNQVDNGYLRFENYRIPRTNLLMAHASVSPDGSYVGPEHPKIFYSGMVDAREFLVKTVADQLAQAVTIAARYSVVRTQGLGPNSALEEEVPIYSYKSQHFRILTLIAKSYAIKFADRSLRADLDQHFDHVHHGDSSIAQHAHILSAGFKAWAAQIAADGAEDARKLCGGQGYLSMSGLCDIVANVHAMPTFEGENYVLWQQCARYLDSSVRHFEAQGTMPDDLSYLANDYGKHHAETSNDAPKCTATGSDFLDADVQLFIYRHRACRLIFKTTTALATARSGVTEAEAWNRHMMASIDAARAHTEYQVLLAIRAQMDAIPPEYKGIMPVLTRVMSLYALSSIINPYSTAAITWAEDGYLSLSQLDDIRAVVDALLGELYYDALALTDAFDFTDASLASAIGCYDGNCYERMMEWVKQVPINVEAAKTGGVYQSGWKKYIEPFVRGIKAKL